jgi:hypothetical protein
MPVRREDCRSVVMKKFSLFLLIFLFSISIASASVKINEIKSKGIEFVEIYNSDEDLLNLSEWAIEDNSTDHPDTITCPEENCSLETNEKYFLILGRAVKIENITSESVIYFYVDDQKIGNGLNDNGDIIAIKKNNITADSYEYGTISNASFSLQLVDNEWCEGAPTPGESNECYVDESPPEEEPENESVPPNNETLNETITENDTEIPREDADIENENADINLTKQIIEKTASNSTENITANNTESKKVIYQAKTDKMRKSALYLAIGLFVILIAYVLKSQSF